MCEDDKGLYERIISRRTVRQFQTGPVPREMLERIVNAGRLAPSAANMQPLEFIAVDDKDVRGRIFPCLKWAAYITPEGGPKAGCEPAAYVVTLVNTIMREKMFEYDVGAAMENMILAAWSEGLGSCWLLSIDRDRLQTILAVPGDYRVDCVLALGFPAEEPVTEALEDSHRYWKDSEGRLHVPKRPLNKVLHLNHY
jgi:nitroreductase